MIRSRTLSTLLFVAAGSLSGQGRAPRLQRVTSALRLDGRFDDAAWATADSIIDFTQRDPREGTPASEGTVVKLVGTAEGLWVALRADDHDPLQIRRAQLRRDADLRSDDHFTLMLSPTNDKRTGFLFSVNANAALSDAEILNFESESREWDGVWDARALVTATGWQAELFIPWQTLRYRDGQALWGVNLRRFIRRKNEEVLWRGWRRTEGIRFLERQGEIDGFTDLPRRAIAEVRPYTAGTANVPVRSFRANGSDSITARGARDGDLGMDVKLAPAPTLTLDLTVNPDFAQADVDRQIVNLTRFPLFFPEQRPFFTEGAGIFDFGRVRQTQLFYSRRIGLGADGTPIPIMGGARLTGRVGRQQVGALVVRTGGAEDATDAVVRVKRDVLGRGYVGAMATFRDAPGKVATGSGGLDFNFPYIIKGQNLVLLGNIAANQDSIGGATTTHSRFVIDYPNDNADIVLRVDRIDAGFDPALGFVQQDGVTRVAGQVELTPRPRRWGIRKLIFSPLEWDYVDRLEGGMSNATFGVQPIGFLFESDDRVEFKVEREYDAPLEPFEIFPGATLAPKTYGWNRAEISVSSSPARLVSTEASISAGEFYDGRSAATNGALRLRLQPHLLASAEWSATHVTRLGGGFEARLARLRVDYAFSPRLNTTLFGQWDNESERVALNARVRWTTSPGSDLFLVWNSLWPSGLASGVPWGRPQRGGAVFKYVRYVRR
ncbi:MAG: carbohydrate binding family 9 domain-containing protein [Gemmatimonadaceae bacterium]|nr:carbohydrate binding family 9 domain-containing protein [Gemmatimonadaceae bacterium]